MDTDALIRQLAEAPPHTRSLPPPYLRAAFWLVLGFPAVALVICLYEPPANVLAAFGDVRMVVEAVAVLLTAVTAAIAAFASEIPGTDRRWLLLPLAPLALWLACLGQGCVADYRALGAVAFDLRPDGCLIPGLLAGIVPTAAIFIMIRRGAPVMPRATLALAALAVGALVNLGLIFFHVGDVSIMVLVWHIGAMALVAAAAAVVAPSLFTWRRVPV